MWFVMGNIHGDNILAKFPFSKIMIKFYSIEKAMLL